MVELASGEVGTLSKPLTEDLHIRLEAVDETLFENIESLVASSLVVTEQKLVSLNLKVQIVEQVGGSISSLNEL